MFGTDHARYTTSHTMWSSTVGGGIHFPACYPITHLCYCWLYAASVWVFLFVCFLKNRKLWPSMQVARNFPSENRVQSTDNKHSISQLEKRTCTSLFCSRRKSKDEKLAASQNRGHSTEHKQASSASRLRATACTELTSLWLYCPPSCYLHLDALCCGSQNRKKKPKQKTHTHLPSRCELTWPQDQPTQNYLYNLVII